MGAASPAVGSGFLALKKLCNKTHMDKKLMLTCERWVHVCKCMTVQLDF